MGKTIPSSLGCTMALQDLLTHYFEKQGYEVTVGTSRKGRSGMEYGIPLLARKAGEEVAVLWKTESPLTESEAHAFQGAIQDLGLKGGILLALGGSQAPPPSAPIEVWDVQRTAQEVGTLLLREALESKEPLKPTPPAPRKASREGGSLLSRAVGASETSPDAILVSGSPSKPSEGSSRPLAYAWTSGGVPSGLVPTSPTVVEVRSRRRESPPRSEGPRSPSPSVKIKPPKGPMDLTPPAPTLPPLPCALPAPTGVEVLEPVVSRESAMALAEPLVGPIRSVRFALVPHVAFEFDAHVESEYFETPLTGKGAVLANAITGSCRMVAPLRIARGLPEAAETLPSKLQAVDVYDKVKDLLLKTFVKEVEITKEIEGNEVSDVQKIRASLDDLHLHHRGVVLVPTWVIQGEKGLSSVDASNATVEGPPAPPPSESPRKGASKDTQLLK